MRLRVPATKIPTQKFRSRDPDTGILHRCPDRILLNRSWQGDLGREIRIQRSCTSGLLGSWRKSPGGEILDERIPYKEISQAVLQDPDADILIKRSCIKDLHKEILHKVSYTILIQRYAQESCVQRSFTSGHTDLAEEILTQTSCTRDSRTEIL